MVDVSIWTERITLPAGLGHGAGQLRMRPDWTPMTWTSGIVATGLARLHQMFNVDLNAGGWPKPTITRPDRSATRQPYSKQTSTVQAEHDRHELEHRPIRHLRWQLRSMTRINASPNVQPGVKRPDQAGMRLVWHLQMRLDAPPRVRVKPQPVLKYLHR